VAATGYDTGVAVADYDNDGFKDIFVLACITTPFVTTMAMELSPT